MRRPNLASAPFLNTRPVWVLGSALLVAAVALTAMSVSEFLLKREEEEGLRQRLTVLQQRREVVARAVAELNRTLAVVPWKQLQGETAALSQIAGKRGWAWTTMLADVERVLPWDVRLVSISPSVDDKGRVRLALVGVAAGRDSWLKLLTRLFSDPSFAEPVPALEEAPSATNPGGYRFQLAVRYLPGGRP
ncbi:MAG: hypothetical protein HRF46_02975 [Acidobacteriota bacterium]